MTTSLTTRARSSATASRSATLTGLRDLAARTPAGRIAAATFTAAVLDASFALVTYVAIAGRYNFETLLQYIATGLLGHDAYRAGWAGVGTAALGFATHLALAGAFAAAFALTAAPRLRSRAAAAAAGIAYGAAVWVLMANAVLPALGVAHEPLGGRYWWAFLTGHALLVGLPISLLTTRHRQ
jgi:hypothetical protein